MSTGTVSSLRTRDVPPPEALAAHARMHNFTAEYERSLHEPGEFWADAARELEWFSPWTTAFEWTYPTFQWFSGGRCNITHNCLDRHVLAGRRNQIALIWSAGKGADQQITYGQLLDFVCRIANGLASLGVSKGDRVVFYMPATVESVGAMLACARIGAIHCVLPAGLGAQALRSRIEEAGARVLLTADVIYSKGEMVSLKPVVREALNSLDQVRSIVSLRRQTAGELLAPREADFYQLLHGRPARFQPVVMEAEDPLCILYTGGVTGKPKGVVHVHGGYMVGAHYHATRFWDLREDDVLFCDADAGSAMGHAAIAYGPLLAGGTALFGESAVDRAPAFWDAVERYRATVLSLSPATIRTLMREDDPQGRDLRNVRLVATTGEPLHAAEFEWTRRALTGAQVSDHWCQAETGSATIGAPVALPVRVGTAGKALPGVEADIADREGNALPAGAAGLLVLRHPFPHLFRTVWGDAEGYARDWRLVPGAYATGDIATRDEDGYITICGRAGDTLNLAGQRVGTAGVEGALMSHAAVEEAAAIGLSDSVHGERIKLFLVLRDGFKPSPELEAELKVQVRLALGTAAVPAVIEFVERLPKTHSGQIVRRVLRARELDEDAGDTSTLAQ